MLLGSTVLGALTDMIRRVSGFCKAIDELKMFIVILTTDYSGLAQWTTSSRYLLS